jgi:hypothetical protein
MRQPFDSHGYVTDTSYPATYHRELSPVWLNYVASLHGAPARPLDRPFTYLELGSGFGHSTLVHAASLPAGEFHLCDFNETCMRSAARDARALAIRNVRFHAVPFDSLLERALPDFDFIVLHGVYSWVSERQRQFIRRLVAEKLKRDGLLYLGYNCLPGWSAEAPLRKLLTELAATASGDSSRRATRAVQTLASLSDSGLAFFDTNPTARAAVDAYRQSSGAYLAHEFLNQTWEPFYSVDVAEEMADAGLSFLGSARLADNHPELILGGPAARTIADLETDRVRQLAVDFALNRQFRRDVFVRSGARANSAPRLDEIVLGCLGEPSGLGTTARVPVGQIRFNARFVAELGSLLTGGSTALSAIAGSLDAAGRSGDEIVRNLLFLTAAGALAPFAQEFDVERATSTGAFTSANVERSLARLVRAGVSGLVAAPTVGYGIELSPSEAATLVDFVRHRRRATMAGRGTVSQAIRLGLLR